MEKTLSSAERAAVLTKFATSLRDMRKQLNYKQEFLAQKLNVSKGIISLWENGLREPTLTNLVALAEFFDVSLDELVGRK